MKPIDPKLPRHVAIIMDGNRRWARKHRIQTALGHRKGVEALRKIIRESSDLGIESLSLYAFSTENWRRDRDEVNALMQLLSEYFLSEIDELDEENVRIRILGDHAGIPEKQRNEIEQAERRTAENSGLKLNIAINYGARDETVRMVRSVLERWKSGSIGTVTEETVSENLDTRFLPDVDLLIRTGGEKRLSNFLLLQCAYAELYFTDVLWPDFDVKAYHDALTDYAGRKRRFGGN